MVKDSFYRLRGKIPISLLLFIILAALGQVGVGLAGSDPGNGTAVQAASAAKPTPASLQGPTGSSRPASAAKAARKGAAKAARTRSARAEQEPPKPGAVAAGRRDPFKLPPPPSPAGPGGPELSGPLPPGVRGLIVGQLRLGGIVRQDTTNTMIAVVTNYTNRAYFLREADAVYNGVVSKITPDSVVFKENFLDPNGRLSSREVVKRLGAGSGEGR